MTSNLLKEQQDCINLLTEAIEETNNKNVITGLEKVTDYFSKMDTTIQTYKNEISSLEEDVEDLENQVEELESEIDNLENVDCPEYRSLLSFCKEAIRDYRLHNIDKSKEQIFSELEHVLFYDCKERW